MILANPLSLDKKLFKLQRFDCKLQVFIRQWCRMVLGLIYTARQIVSMHKLLETFRIENEDENENEHSKRACFWCKHACANSN